MTASASSRPNTPQPASSSASDEQTDEDALRKLVIVIFDILKLQQLVMQLFETVISPKLPKLGGGSIMPVDGHDDTPEGTHIHSCMTLTLRQHLVQPLSLPHSLLSHLLRHLYFHSW